MKAKAILIIATAVILTGSIGRVDFNTLNGKHSIEGYVVNGKVVADNGNTYSASSFDAEGKVTVTLDKSGNVTSITSNK